MLFVPCEVKPTNSIIMPTIILTQWLESEISVRLAALAHLMCALLFALHAILVINKQIKKYWR